MDISKKNRIINDYNKFKDALESLVLESSKKQEEIDSLNNQLDKYNIKIIYSKKQLTIINKLINRVKYNTMEIKLEEYEKKVFDLRSIINRYLNEKKLIDKTITKYKAFLKKIENDYPFLVEEIEKTRSINIINNFEKILNNRKIIMEKYKEDSYYLTNIDIVNLYSKYYILNQTSNNNLFNSFLLDYGIKYDLNINKFYFINDAEFIIDYNNENVDINALNRLDKLVNKEVNKDNRR